MSRLRPGGEAMCPGALEPAGPKERGVCFPWAGGSAGETGTVHVPWLKPGAPSPLQPFKQPRVLRIRQDEGTGGKGVDALTWATSQARQIIPSFYRGRERLRGVRGLPGRGHRAGRTQPRMQLGPWDPGSRRWEEPPAPRLGEGKGLLATGCWSGRRGDFLR